MEKKLEKTCSLTNLVTRWTGSMRKDLRSILRRAGRSFCSWSRKTLRTSRSWISWSTSRAAPHWFTQYVSNARSMCVESRNARPTRASVKRWNSYNKCIAVRKVATRLRELTCHMGSHSVTCHPAEVTLPPLPPTEAGTRLSDPGGMQGWVDLVSGSGISWAICKSAPRSMQITTPAPHHSVSTGRVPFLPPNQQRQNTEGTHYGHLIYKTRYEWRKAYLWTIHLQNRKNCEERASVRRLIAYDKIWYEKS